jgi:hypothetical protein
MYSSTTTTDGVSMKTANKRGSTSWVWRHGAELWEASGPYSKKAHWLCHRCWDRNKTKVVYTSSTTPAINHMKDVHYWNSDGPIVYVPGESIADQLTALVSSVDANDQTTATS